MTRLERLYRAAHTLAEEGIDRACVDVLRFIRTHETLTAEERMRSASIVRLAMSKQRPSGLRERVNAPSMDEAPEALM